MTTSPHKNICKVPQLSSEFQTQIQPQRPGRFSNASQSKQTLNIPLCMVKLFITLWMVYQYTQSSLKIQASFLTQLTERKESAQGFPHEVIGDFKTVTEFNGCDRRKLRIDQQHCIYSTILT